MSLWFALIVFGETENKTSKHVPGGCVLFFLFFSFFFRRAVSVTHANVSWLTALPHKSLNLTQTSFYS